MPTTDRRSPGRPVVALIALILVALSGCHALPISGGLSTDSRVGGHVTTDSKVAGRFEGAVDVRIPTAPDPGPMVPVVVRPARGGRPGPKVALIDVDGLILNQDLTGLYSVGENPVAAFREKLEAAAGDPAVRALVVRINSPGGGVTASDILAEDLRRFRAQTGKPAVACLMDLATGGAYYLAVGCDRIVAHPTTVTGGVGALINHFNLQDAMGALNVVADPVKAGEMIDMGTVTGPLPEDATARTLLQQMVDGFRDRFAARVAARRPAMTAADRRAIGDGRVVPAPKALALHMVDALGYLDDAIAEAERLAGAPGAEVVLYRRAGHPTRSVYGITPNVPIQGEIVPFSYPGLDRSKLPTFLYLWQPDPTLSRPGGR
jgi:protease IV